MPPEPTFDCDWSSRRLIELPRLLPIWADALADPSLGSRLRLLALVRRALRIERARSAAGHWAYDVARHTQLLRAYRSEVAQLIADRRNNDAAATPATPSEDRL